MECERFVELFQSFRIERFDGLAYFFMNLLSSFLQQAVISDFLGEGVFKDILQLRKKTLLVNEFQSLKVKKMGFEFLSHAHDRL